MKNNIKNIILGFVFVLFVSMGISSSQYYYFDVGGEYSQGCDQTINIRATTESDSLGARAGLLRLRFDPMGYSYYTGLLSSDLRAYLTRENLGVFLKWTSDQSPSWQDLDNKTMLQIDRYNELVNYKGTSGIYISIAFVPHYNISPYTGYMYILYDGGTFKTSLSRDGVNIIDPAKQNQNLTGIIKVVQKPCRPDTNKPLLTISRPINGATRQSYLSGIVFNMTDNVTAISSVPYVWTGGGVWTSNVYGINDQYGIDLNSFSITIAGNGQSKIFSGSEFDINNLGSSKSVFSSLKTWQYLDKNYSGYILSGQLVDRGIEKTTIITGYVSDRAGNKYTLGSFVFNNPVGPTLLGSRNPNSGATYVDVNAPIKLGIRDDRAGVDSGSIRVTLSGINGTIYGPYIFSGSDLNLSGVVGTANTPDYYITIYPNMSLPSSGNVLVKVYAQDNEGNVDTISDYSFGTRPDCFELGCCNQISIKTGINYLPFFYPNYQIYISGGNNARLITGVDGTGYIDCNVPWAGIPIYRGDAKNSGNAQYVAFLGSNVLRFSGSNNVEIILDGNTIYLSTIYVPPFIGPSGGGGGVVPVYVDDCLLPWSTLPGANYSGIDYSDSLYDNDCSAPFTGMHGAADFCDTSYTGDEYDVEQVLSYQFCYDVGITNKCPIHEAKLKDSLLRRDLVKMLVYFAVKIMGITPDLDKQGCDQYEDLKTVSAEVRAYAKLGCQLEIMGMQSDGITPLKNFMPDKPVTRAQFGTTMSRLIFGEKYNGENPMWYSDHLQALQDYGIMKYISKPDMIELRGFVMIMFKRTYDKGLPALNYLAVGAKNAAIAIK